MPVTSFLIDPIFQILPYHVGHCKIKTDKRLTQDNFLYVPTRDQFLHLMAILLF